MIHLLLAAQIAAAPVPAPNNFYTGATGTNIPTANYNLSPAPPGIVVSSFGWRTAPDGWIEVNAVVTNASRWSMAGRMFCKAYDRSGIIVGALDITIFEMARGEVQQIGGVKKPVRHAERLTCVVK